MMAAAEGTPSVLVSWPSSRVGSSPRLKSLLERRDFSVATEAQLKMAKKLIEESPRLMEKIP
jgi:hypothetical protein